MRVVDEIAWDAEKEITQYLWSSNEFSIPVQVFTISRTTCRPGAALEWDVPMYDILMGIETQKAKITELRTSIFRLEPEKSAIYIYQRPWILDNHNLELKIIQAGYWACCPLLFSSRKPVCNNISSSRYQDYILCSLVMPYRKMHQSETLWS